MKDLLYKGKVYFGISDSFFFEVMQDIARCDIDNYTYDSAFDKKNYTSYQVGTYHRNLINIEKARNEKKYHVELMLKYHNPEMENKVHCYDPLIVRRVEINKLVIENSKPYSGKWSH